jgi:hypothetical protein
MHGVSWVLLRLPILPCSQAPSKEPFVDGQLPQAKVVEVRLSTTQTCRRLSVSNGRPICRGIEPVWLGIKRAGVRIIGLKMSSRPPPSRSKRATYASLSQHLMVPASPTPLKPLVLGNHVRRAAAAYSAASNSWPTAVSATISCRWRRRDHHR